MYNDRNKTEKKITQTKKTTDEFLIKKKDPLILPPDYDTLPIPKTKKTREAISSLESTISTANNSKSESEAVSYTHLTLPTKRIV